LPDEISVVQDDTVHQISVGLNSKEEEIISDLSFGNNYKEYDETVHQIELNSKEEEIISVFSFENKNKAHNNIVDQISVESNSEDETISDFNFENKNKEYLDCQNVPQSSSIANFIRPCRTDSITIKNQFFSKHPIQPFVKSGN